MKKIELGKLLKVADPSDERQTVELVMERQTKDTYHYNRSVGSQRELVVSIYVRDYAIRRDPPKKIRVTTEPQ